MITSATDTTLDATYEQLAARFTASFPAARVALRTIGREGEFPIVGARGEAVDARRLWNVLIEKGDLDPEYGAGRPGETFIVGLKGEEYSYALEVGLGTIEINTRPCRNLFEVTATMERAVLRLVHAASRFGWRVLGYGVQPLSPATLGLMAPKQRYLSLYRAMGESWLWYTVTASDQLHVAIGRSELVFMINYGSIITPIIIALCANSPVYGGKVSPYCSAREGVMGAILANEHRHGMLAHPVESIAEFVAMTAQATHLIMRDAGQVIPVARPFSGYLREHGPDYDAFLFHEHYIWNSARLRAAYGTIEVRPACQQPWNEHWAVSALILGLIEAAPEIDTYIRAELGAEYWTRMQTYHQQGIRHGLGAPQPTPGFLRTVVGLAEQGLRVRGHGEEKLLAPIWLRLERGLAPAQRARAVFQADGMAGLLSLATIRP